jgi:hypothetical protein
MQYNDFKLRLCSVVVSYPTPTAVNYSCALGCRYCVTYSTLETGTGLKGQYGQREGPLRRRFRVRGRVLAPHIPVGSFSGSPVAGVLGINLHHCGIRYCQRLFTLSTY